MKEINLNLEANNRPDHFVLNPLSKEKLDSKKPTISERVTTTLLPLLSLNSKTGAIAHLSAAGYQAYNLTSKPLKESAPQYVYLVSTTALALVAPRLKAIVTLTTHVVQLGQHAWNKDWANVQTDALHITHQGVYVASIFYATPALLALSLTTQACYEFYQASQFIIQDGLYWEAASYTLVGIVRGYQAIPHVQTAYWDQFGSELDEDTWHTIYKKEISSRTKEDKKELLDVKSLLTKYGVRTNMSIYNIPFGSYDLSCLSFKNLRFKNCDFSKSTIQGSTFDNVQMVGCKGKNSVWDWVSFNNTSFVDCSFEKAKFKSINFFNCYIDDSNFTDAKMRGVMFNHTTIYDSSFIKTENDRHENWRKVSFNNTVIKESEFCNSIWKDVFFNNSQIRDRSDFSECRFERSSFIFTTIADSDFEKTEWYEVKFCPSSTFVRSNLEDADFSFSDSPTFNDCKIGKSSTHQALSNAINVNSDEYQSRNAQTKPVVTLPTKIILGDISSDSSEDMIKLDDNLQATRFTVRFTYMRMWMAKQASKEALEAFAKKCLTPEYNFSDVSTDDKIILRRVGLVDEKGQVDEITRAIYLQYRAGNIVYEFKKDPQ